MGIIQALRFFIEIGGMTAILLIITAVILMVASADRLYFLYSKFSRNVDESLIKIRESVLKRDYAQALQICNSAAAPQLSVVKAGLIAVDNGREAMKSALGGAVLEVSRLTEKRVSIIALIAAVSTLLGLFGTITGLIKTFDALAKADASEKAQLLGLGISEAMYCTATGLGIGILAMVIHTLCTSKGDDIVGQSQGVGYKLITWIEESERGQS